MNKQRMTLLALLPMLSNCYYFYDEGLQEYDVHGKVVIEAQAVGISSFSDLSEDELRAFINDLGVVYVGAWAGVSERQGFLQPNFDPFSQNSFPYGGTTLGVYTNSGLPALSCEMITGRFESMQNIIDHFDLRVRGEEYDVPDVVSRYLAWQEAIADDQVDEAEAAELALMSAYPVFTEAEYVSFALRQNYFRMYLPETGAGCQYDSEGNLLVETCEISDFDFYGHVPWVVNGDGNLEAPFTVYKVPMPLDESGNNRYPVLWAFVDQAGATCDGADGYYTQDFDLDTYAGMSYYDLMNYPCQYLASGDLYSDFDATSTTQRANKDGTEVIVTINKQVPTLTAEQLVDGEGVEYDYPFCGY